MDYLGDYNNTETVDIPFNTFSSNDPSASVTVTDLVAADVKIHKDGSTTQRASASGVTVSIDFDGITGNHMIHIDLSDDTDAGYYADVSRFQVRLEGITVDAATLNPWIGAFSIGCVLRLNTTATANLEDQYDTTGLTGDTFPGTQAQLSNITNTGSATNKPASSFTSTTIGSETNTYAATEALDGNYHELTDSGGVFDGYYEFLIGAGIPSSVQHTGYLTGNNDDLGMYGYDWDAAAWVQIGSIQGSNSTSNAVNSFDMFVNMVGKGTDFGKVRVRPYKASGLTSATLKTDQIFIAFSQESVSALDAVYFDSNTSNPGTTNLDGVPGNPVSTEAAVNTLLAARNLYRVAVSLKSSITFATSHVNEIWEGPHWTLANGGQDLSGSHFIRADVTGIATASVDPIDYGHCEIGTCTLPQFHAVHCDFNGTVTFGEAGDYHIAHSRSGIAGANTPIFDTGAAIANVNFSVGGWENGFELQNHNNAGTDLFSISGKGQIVYAASCSGTVNQRGDWKVTNTGGVTITADDNTTNVTSILVDTGTTLDKKIQDIIALVESFRGHHTHQGEVYYWDPINGNDGNDGLTKETARLTFASTYTLVTAYNHDTIIAVAGDTSLTTTDEMITMNKEYSFLRGPGRDFGIIATTGGDVVTLTGEGIEFSGFRVETHTTGTGSGIVASGDFILLKDFWVEYSRSHAVELNGCQFTTVEDFLIQNAGQTSGHGILVDGSSGTTAYNKIHDGIIRLCGNDGIHVKGANSANNYISGRKSGLNISHNTGWGIYSEAGTNDTHLSGPILFVVENTGGQISLNGTGDIERNVEQWANDADLTTHDGKLEALISTIGVAGAGLLDLGGMSTGMKAEVNAECDTANTDYGALKGGTAMTESYAADGAEATPEQAFYQIMQFLGEFSIAGTTYTVKGLDGSTTKMTFTLDSGTAPTAINRAT